MRVIIAGSRTITDPAVLREAIYASGFDITEVVSGTAGGVDSMGENWARRNNIPVRRFPARWKELGRGAGYARNIEMAAYGEALIAVWDGRSRGTQHMIRTARELERLVFVYNTAATITTPPMHWGGAG